MSDIRTLSHPDLGDYFNAQDLIRYLVTQRDQVEASGEKGVASVLDRLVVDLATPLMLRDGRTPAADDALHTEPEQGDADQ